MNYQTIFVHYDINRKEPLDLSTVIHADDVGTRVLELALCENGEALAVGAECAVTANIVEQKTKALLKDGIVCDVSQDGHILVPVDDLQTRGKMELSVEIIITDETAQTTLALPYPVWVRVNPSVLDDAEVVSDSQGTIPELLEDARNAVEQSRYALTEEDKQEIAGMVEVPTKTSELTNDSGFLTQHQSLANYYTTAQMNNLLDGKSNAGHTHSQYLTAHQDISGKENSSNKTTALSADSTDAQYPSAKAVVDYVGAGLIPSYVAEEAERVLNKAFAHKNLGRTVRFIAVADTHDDATDASHTYTKTANRHCGQAVKYIADRIPLDFAAFLGDGTWAGVAHTTAQYHTDWLKADLHETNSFLAEGFRGVPNIRCVGDHDQCAATGGNGNVTRLQNSGAYQFFGRYNTGETVALNNYGYYDIEKAKLRVIYLNTSDTTDSSAAGTLLAVSQAQKNWLCETLIALNTKTDAASWKILLLSHAPLDMVDDIADDILLPYSNGGAYGSYTFTNHAAAIIGNCHGHTHSYKVGYMGNKIRRFAIPNANFYDNNHYKSNAGYSAWNEQTTYLKTENYRTDTSFSLVTIDLDNNACYVDNYGAGYDRTFTTHYNAGAPTGISNIVYRGTTTVGATIDTNAFRYTAAYANGTTANLTAAVSVNPSTIAQPGNNTVTVSYTENGATVSGTVTVTGTSAPAGNLLSLNRTIETAAMDALISFDTAKCYKNISYGTSTGHYAGCTVNSITASSIALQESGVGGITVGYAVELPNTAHSYTFSCDYAGTGAGRVYYNIFDSNGTQLEAAKNLVNAAENASGSATYEIAAPTGAFKWLVVMFSSSTGGAKTYSNVSLTENV